MKIKVRGLDRHRNGVSGTPFWAVLFDDEEGHELVGVVFDEPHHVAVLGLALLADPSKGVAFGFNSWRGDVYEPGLRAAIDRFERGAGAVAPRGSRC